MRRLQIAASKIGARLFRQQVGMAWIGAAVKIDRTMLYPVRKGDVVIKSARPFHAGVPGMSDLGGWLPTEITPDMVGMVVALYAQVEVKENGRPSKEQIAWIDAVKKAGGIAGIARSEDDLTQILRR